MPEEKTVEIAQTNLTLGGTYRTTFLADSDASVNNIPSRKWEYGIMALWTWTSVATGTILTGYRVDSRTHIFEWTVDSLIDYDFLPTANVDKAVGVITFELNRHQKYGVKLAPLQTEVISKGTAPTKNVLEQAGEAAGNTLKELLAPIIETLKPIAIPLVIGVVALVGFAVYTRVKK